MAKQSRALTELPPAVRALLRELGTNLSIARKRRKESRRTWAARIGVSEPLQSAGAARADLPRGAGAAKPSQSS